MPTPGSQLLRCGTRLVNIGRAIVCQGQFFVKEWSASANKAMSKLEEIEVDPDVCSLQPAHMESNLFRLSLQVASRNLPHLPHPLRFTWDPRAFQITVEVDSSPPS